MTRSHKFNDKNHAGLAEGTVAPHDNVPKFFAKHGWVGADPKKAKKNGGGKSNWGPVGSEVAEEDFNFVNARRRPSNSSSFSAHGEFKTKFEIIEPEPVFEERLHGPELEDEIALSKIETSSSAGSSSDEQK